MLTELGFSMLMLTFALSLYSAGAAAYGTLKGKARWVESARRGMLLSFPLLTVAVGALLILLAGDHFELEYVWSVSSIEMPLYLKLTALWGGQAGSLLFWSWLMSAFIGGVMLRRWERDREFLPWVIVVTAVTLAFFLSLNIFFTGENPFARLWQNRSGDVSVAMFAPAGRNLFVPANGQGLNPLLRHPGMVIHPPALYLGFVGFVIPYAFAMAALVTGRSDDRWIRLTRRWTLWAWLFLSGGLVLGMRWAYDVLGWGGYWGWDPVEIAALLPWLVATPFLHTVIIQEKRGMFKQLNMFLIILTYIMVIVGTFLTRSGVFSSVHAFAQSAIGPMFFVFIAISLVISIALLIHRWKDLVSEVPLGNVSMLSREAFFLLSALLFGLFFLVCLVGILFPLISEVVSGQKITYGPAFYRLPVAVILGGLMVLMGLGPLSSWTVASLRAIGRAAWKPAAAGALAVLMLFVLGMRNVVALAGFGLVVFVLVVSMYETWRAAHARQAAHQEGFLQALGQIFQRNRRRYGGYVIHIAMVIMALGILGIELFQTTTQQSVATGETIELAGFDLRFDGLEQFVLPDGRWVTRAVMSVSREGRVLGDLYPRYDIYADGQPVTIPAIRSTPAGDLYVILVNWEQISSDQAPFKVYYNPLVMWLWIGSLVFVAGIIITAWPEREKENR